MIEQANDTVSIELRLGSRPLLSMIGSARRFVQELYAPLVGPDASSRMGMAAHELLENLAKYSDDGPVRLEVAYLPDGDYGIARVTTTNRVASSRLNELTRVLDDLSNTADPRARYLDYMNTSVGRKEGSGLGLIRICAEGEMRIHYSTTENEVTIHAEARILTRNL
jgi:hypothetical protein